MHPPTRRTRLTLSLTAVLLLALWLRLHGADSQSLWYDEGTSVSLAGRSLAQIARAAANDIHPPLYYGLLALWVRLAGDSVLAMRALSALLGTLVVAGIFALGRRLWSEPVGLAAALLAAWSPYLVWYGQEVRMYSLAAAWAVGLMLLNNGLGERIRGLDSGLGQRMRGLRWERGGVVGWGGWVWVAYGGVATAALYTQYFAGVSTLVASNGIMAAAVARWWWRARTGVPGGFLARWVVVQVVPVVLFLPWLAVAWPAIRDWPAISAAVTAAFLVRESWRTFAVGQRVPPMAVVWLLVPVVVAGVGLAARGKAGDRWGGVVAGIWLVAPVVVMGALSLSRPAWNAKLLIVGAPAFELLLGAGVVGAALAAGRAVRSGRRRAGVATALTAAALVALLFVPRARVLWAMAFDPRYQRDDYRGIAREIEDHAGPADAVILNAPTQIEVFDYYDRGRHPSYPLPLGRPADRADTLRRLEEVGRRHDHLYAVLWATAQSDPDGLVERWLNAHRHKVSDRWYGDVRLALWAAPPERATMTTTALDVRFGEAIRLARVEQGPPAARAGGMLPFTLSWQPLGRPAADYVVFVHLLDDGGRLVAQRDMRPVGGSAPTSSWAAGDERPTPIEDRIGLALPGDLAPGAYRLVVGLYDPATRQRLPVTVGRPAAGPAAATADAYELGVVRVER